MSDVWFLGVAGLQETLFCFVCSLGVADIHCLDVFGGAAGASFLVGFRCCLCFPQVRIIHSQSFTVVWFGQIKPHWYTRAPRQMWRRNGFRAESYDINRGPECDILSQEGFMALTALIMRLVWCTVCRMMSHDVTCVPDVSGCHPWSSMQLHSNDIHWWCLIAPSWSFIWIHVHYGILWYIMVHYGAFVSDLCALWISVVLCGRLLPQAMLLLGPPCSLFIFLSSSCHQRSPSRPYGDVSKLCVRVSNQILHNTVAWHDLLVHPTFCAHLCAVVRHFWGQIGAVI